MYLISEARIAIPHSWKDKTINVFALDAGEGSFVITRDDLPTGGGLSEYVSVQLSALRNMPGYVGLGEREMSVSARPAYLHEYRWMNEQAEVFQIVTIVDIAERVLVLTRTSETAFDDAERGQLHAMLESIVLTPRM